MTKQSRLMALRLTNANGRPEYEQSHPFSFAMTEDRWTSLRFHRISEQTILDTDYWTWCAELEGYTRDNPVGWNRATIVVRQSHRENQMVVCCPNELTAILWKLRWGSDDT